ncbi:hypothetical protein DSO57_1008394 [Entomophthora muscae]|uniref:Uncharacterized protein n=1 Tax=Entomophthora muscae TaxID=34485 RepID=A0ACC2TU22_9FUNG|nr:hypothetical protein DSO57_1008394 [Entomophthora muscae]
MWVITTSGRLMGPAAVWFTNRVGQEQEVTWSTFRDDIKSFYSENFSPIVVGTPLLAIKQAGSVHKYLEVWQQALAAAPEAVTDRKTMLLTLIVNGLKPHICKWVPIWHCTSIKNCYKAIMEANKQALMGFCRSNDAPPQSYPAPSSAHNQVGCHQSCQQENGIKRHQKGESEVPVHQSPKYVLGHSQGPTGRSYHSLVRENVSQKYV